MLIKRENQGYSLIEVVLVIFIFSIITFVGISITYQRVPEKKLMKEGEDLKSKLFMAQQDANARLADKSYGVKFFTDRFMVFTGDSYASADREEETIFPNGIEIDLIDLDDASTEVVFDSGGFRPSSSGSIRVTDGENTYSVGINSEGLIYDF